MSANTIGIIGDGNVGSALAQGLKRAAREVRAQPCVSCHRGPLAPDIVLMGPGTDQPDAAPRRRRVASLP